jgi:antitoxin VapB
MVTKTAKVFRSGNSQAVRIPKEFQIEGTEVEIRRRGDTLILRPKRKSWASLLESLAKFSDDFAEGGREQPGSQERDEVFK